jgi:hypothetical protein
MDLVRTGAMARLAFLAAVSLGLAACAARETPRYVVRLDLDQVAARTAASDHRPGFTTLGA